MKVENNKNLTPQEIEKLPSYKKERRKKRWLLVMSWAFLLAGILMILGGSLLIIFKEDYLAGGVILIAFGGMILFSSIGSFIFSYSSIQKDNNLREILIKQGIREVFGEDSLFSSKIDLSKKFLIETGLSSLEVEKTQEQIVTMMDGYRTSIFSLSSANPLIDASLGTLGAMASGSVVLGAALGTLSAISDIKDKRTPDKMFDGTIILLSSLRYRLKGSIEVRPKKCFSPSSVLLSNKNSFETEYQKANKEYNFYASDIEEGFLYITSEVLLSISKINDLFKDGVIFIFKEDYMLIAINKYKLDINKYSKDVQLSAKECYFKVKEHLETLKKIDLCLNLSSIMKQ